MTFRREITNKEQSFRFQTGPNYSLYSPDLEPCDYFCSWN